MSTILHLTNTIYSDTVLKHNVSFSIATKNCCNITLKKFDLNFNTDFTGV
jgi:hypothetical protein